MTSCGIKQRQPYRAPLMPQAENGRWVSLFGFGFSFSERCVCQTFQTAVHQMVHQVGRPWKQSSQTPVSIVYDNEAIKSVAADDMVEC